MSTRNHAGRGGGQASREVVRIGGASGFWGDTAMAAPQLLERGEVDFLVFDYLAEVTMSILAAKRAKDASQGYANDFVDITMRSLLPEIRRRGVRVVANAGGVNPLACREALAAVAKELGIEIRIGVVLGDDLVHRAEEFAASGIREMFDGSPFPERPVSINAYLGAVPIARALDAGCDVVITGRGVDSAVTLGAMMHAFGWRETDYDLLAQGSLAGHLIECGAQCTGGLFTDWREVPGWENIGFPIVEARADGSFVITKAPGTGGLVTPATVGEQLLYEIGDPRSYLLPDVRCDFTAVRFEADGPERVRVTGARGRAPSASVKVSATYADGYRNTAFLTIIGAEAAAKARRTGETILARTRSMLAAQGLPDYSETRIEVLGAEESLGAQGRADAREVVLKIAVRSDSAAALRLFAREFAPAGTSMAPGTTGLLGGRPSPSPVIRLFSFLLPKDAIDVTVDVEGEVVEVPFGPGSEEDDIRSLPPALAFEPAVEDAGVPMRTVELLRIAHGRSGDKGNKANIGIIARDARWLPWLSLRLTPEAVAAHFAHRSPRLVERFDLPGMGAINFLLHDVLGGGGMASLHTDNLAKAYAQVLLTMPVSVPEALLGESRQS
jgi:hypothetical protein